MVVELRDGSVVADKRLDRLIEFDEASRAYSIENLDLPTALKGRTWPLPVRLDQRRQGACVLFAFTHDLCGSPVPVKFGSVEAAEAFARENYWEVQRGDEFPGGEYPGATPQSGGTSVLSAVKKITALGYYDSYYWAFNIDQVLQALSHEGPLIFGTWWLNSMWETRPSGLLEVGNPDNPGERDGGHGYLARGLILKPRLKGEKINEPVIRYVNNWNRTWGADGEFYMKVSDAERLQKADGEVCAPVGRKRP